MRLFGRQPAVRVAVPDTAYRPTSTVPVQVSVAQAVEDVRTARVEIGYLNGYRYRWAGRRDAMANADDGSFLTGGQVGTDHGSERDTEDWVVANGVDLPVAGGTVATGEHRVDVRLPSWSPGSASDTVAWQARVTLVRDRRSVESGAGFRVVVPAPDPPPAQVLEQGTSALQSSLTWAIVTDRPCCRAGEEIRGVVRLTPREPVSRPCELAVQLIRERLSHPLDRTPGSTTEQMVRPHTVVGRGVVLEQGRTLELPFVAPVPADTDPTCQGVHSSLRWYLQGRVMFEGLTGGVERARLSVVVHTG